MRNRLQGPSQRSHEQDDRVRRGSTRRVHVYESARYVQDRTRARSEGQGGPSALLRLYQEYQEIIAAALLKRSVKRENCKKISARIPRADIFSFVGFL